MGKILNRLSDWYFSKAALPHWIVLIFDCCVVFLVNMVFYSLNYHLVPPRGSVAKVLFTLLVYLIPYLIGFRIMRTYVGLLRYTGFTDLLRIGTAMLISLAIIAVARYGFHLGIFLYDHGIDVLVVIAFRVLCESLVLSTLAIWGTRMVVRYCYEFFYNTDRQQNVFIYGIKEGGVALAKSIRTMKPSEFALRGFFTDDEKEVGKELMQQRVFFLSDDAVEVMKSRNASVLLVSPAKSEAFSEKTELQNKLLEAGIGIRMVPGFLELEQNASVDVKQLKEVEIEDLLPRKQIEVDMDAIGALLVDKVILITGSAGSIGSEMVRQVARYKPRKLILIDQAETPQHDLRLMMARRFPYVVTHTIVTSICNAEHIEDLFAQYRPDYVFHAAAYKHVPMMEDNPSIAVQNNVRGTQVVAMMAVKYGVKKFVMISTDKAVNPTNVMGCSKRICEIDVQSLDAAIKRGEIKMYNGEPAVTQFVTTRFGNVLGSNGSVIPLFREQIKHGGPVTVTHPDIIRYFMLISEACKLVLEAGTMGHGGEIFVFDMGEPVKIVDLARRMIALSGVKDIAIQYTGLRDGEKLYEEMLSDKENTIPTTHPKIMVAKVRQYDHTEVCAQLERLYEASLSFDDMAVVKIMKEMVPEFKSQHSKYEALDRVG